MTNQPVSIDLLETLFQRTVGRVGYRLGSKPPLGADSQSFDLSDCSGWVRWALDRCGLRLPDGSQPQLQWCLDNGLHELTHYSDVHFAQADGGRLFICFLKPQPGEDWPRHVWLVWKGMTWECHGGVGVSSRPWGSSVLIGCVDAFEIPCAP